MGSSLQSKVQSSLHFGIHYTTVICLAAALLFAGCGEEIDDGESEEREPEIVFKHDGTLSFMRDADTLAVIDIEIADTETSRERGLMNREGLPEMSGMLFIFPDEDYRGFWMADTPLSLDLIFADGDGDIVNIEKYARPYSAESIESDGPARYVVEVPAGFSDRYGLLSSDHIEWQRE